MFLDLPNCRIISIIRLKSYTEKNSTHAQASQTESTYKDRRLTRNFKSSTSARTTIPLISKLNRNAKERGTKGKFRSSQNEKKIAIL